MTINQIRKIRKIKVINDIEKYRGFYFQMDDGYIVANFCSNINKGLDAKYSLGFKTNGKSVIEHLYIKLLNNNKLSKFEKAAFYEQIYLFNPIIQNAGKWYDFKKVLHKIKGIEFYIINNIISKKEINIFNENNISNIVNIEELSCCI